MTRSSYRASKLKKLKQILLESHGLAVPAKKRKRKRKEVVVDPLIRRMPSIFDSETPPDDDD